MVHLNSGLRMGPPAALYDMTDSLAIHLNDNIRFIQMSCKSH